jgi:hypothetical protein
MSQAERPKRLQPRITRGGFRFQFGAWFLWTVLQLVLVVMGLGTGTAWDAGGFLSLAGWSWAWGAWDFFCTYAVATAISGMRKMPGKMIGKNADEHYDAAGFSFGE